MNFKELKRYISKFYSDITEALTFIDLVYALELIDEDVKVQSRNWVCNCF